MSNDDDDNEVTITDPGQEKDSQRRREDPIVTSISHFEEEVLRGIERANQLKRRSYLIAGVGSAIGLIVVVLAFWATLKTKESVKSSPPLSMAGWPLERIVSTGDLAYKMGDYDQAVDLYLEADLRLSEMVSFESHSPSPDVDILQHFYNTQPFLKTRLELARLAREISRSPRFNKKPSTKLSRKG